MAFALGDRQAIIMGADATDEDVVAVDDQVVGSDGAGEIGRCRLYIVDAVGRRHMFHGDLQLGQAPTQRVQYRLDEDCFTIEDID